MTLWPGCPTPSSSSGRSGSGPIDLEVGWAERVAILGPNGSGKTTLLGALLGRLPLTSGTQWLGPASWSASSTRPEPFWRRPLLAAFQAGAGSVVGERPGRCWPSSASGPTTSRPAASLSPGERTRAVLALLMARGVNCLVLDEPTNHLDLPAIEQLEQALDTYDGTLLLVTHDRRLLDAVHIDRTISRSRLFHAAMFAGWLGLGWRFVHPKRTEEGGRVTRRSASGCSSPCSPPPRSAMPSACAVQHPDL